MVRSSAECFLCALEDEVERKCIEAYLSELVMDAKGLCTSHFALLLKMIQDMMRSQSQEIIKTMIDVEEKNFSQLKSELSEYIRRQSYEFSDKDRKAVEGVLLKSVQKNCRQAGNKA